MSFDARSRERLEALGRQLPRKLPVPVPPSPASPGGSAVAPATGGRHRVETEQDPERLFRELMDVSPDGSVPPHLLERLRSLESRRPAPPAEAPSETAGPSRGAAAPPLRRAPARRAPLGSAEREMYTAFEHLLLEDDETDGRS